ncbi:unnamed protein product [Effrenium voratum]|nr:unnamed protein product [Effrenium voratum]
MPTCASRMCGIPSCPTHQKNGPMSVDAAGPWRCGAATNTRARPEFAFREVHSLMFKVQPLEREKGPERGRSFSTESDVADPGEEAQPPPLEAEILEEIPLDEEGQLTSIGSVLHGSGECRPCAFLGSERRPCSNGAACLFCHLPHDPRRKVRLGRRKRLVPRSARPLSTLATLAVANARDAEWRRGGAGGGEWRHRARAQVHPHCFAGGVRRNGLRRLRKHLEKGRAADKVSSTTELQGAATGGPG